PPRFFSAPDLWNLPGHLDPEQPEQEQHAHQDVDDAEEHVRAAAVAEEPAALARRLLLLSGPERELDAAPAEQDDQRGAGCDGPCGQHGHTRRNGRRTSATVMYSSACGWVMMISWKSARGRSSSSALPSARISTVSTEFDSSEASPKRLP